MTSQHQRSNQRQKLISEALEQIRRYLETVYLNEQGFGTIVIVCKPEEVQVDRNSGMRIKVIDEPAKP